MRFRVRERAGRDRCCMTKGAARGAWLIGCDATALDDEEQPARHESALAADRRRARNSIANVALLRCLNAALRTSGSVRCSADSELPFVDAIDQLARRVVSGTRSAFVGRRP